MPGVSLTAVDATGVLQRIASGGTPPADILGALVVPSGAQIVGTTTEDAGVDQYDRSMQLPDHHDFELSSQVLPDELKRARWSLLGTYAIAEPGHRGPCPTGRLRRLRVGGRRARDARQPVDLALARR